MQSQCSLTFARYSFADDELNSGIVATILSVTLSSLAGWLGEAVVGVDCHVFLTVKQLITWWLLTEIESCCIFFFSFLFLHLSFAFFCLTRSSSDLILESKPEYRPTEKSFPNPSRSSGDDPWYLFLIRKNERTQSKKQTQHKSKYHERRRSCRKQ